MDDISLRLLYGGSTFIPELDYEAQDTRIYDSYKDYETYILTESIGTDDFETNYYLFINDINIREIDSLKHIFYIIIEKIDKVYNFNFSEEIELDFDEEREWLLEFIKFIEFDNINFLTELYNELDIDLFQINLDDFLQNNSKQITFTIQTMINTYSYNKFILDFLLNYNLDDFIKWLKKQTEKHKNEIVTNIKMKGEELNE